MSGLQRLHRAFNKRAYKLATRGSDWARLFRELDSNHDGALTRTEVEYATRVILGLHENEVSDADVTDFVARFDIDGNGKLSLKEVSRFLQLPFNWIASDADHTRRNDGHEHAGTPCDAATTPRDPLDREQPTALVMHLTDAAIADTDGANEAFLLRFGAIVGGANHEERLIRSMEKILRDYASARKRMRRDRSIVAEAAEAGCIADLVRAAKGGAGLSEVDSLELVHVCIRCTHPGVAEIERCELECVHAATLWIARVAQLSQARQDELSEHGAVSALIERAPPHSAKPPHSASPWALGTCIRTLL
jgi:hypothetical protein